MRAVGLRLVGRRQPVAPVEVDSWRREVAARVRRHQERREGWEAELLAIAIVAGTCWGLLLSALWWCAR